MLKGGRYSVCLSSHSFLCPITFTKKWHYHWQQKKKRRGTKKKVTVTLMRTSSFRLGPSFSPLSCFSSAVHVDPFFKTFNHLCAMNIFIIFIIYHANKVTVRVSSSLIQLHTGQNMCFKLFLTWKIYSLILGQKPQYDYRKNTSQNSLENLANIWAIGLCWIIYKNTTNLHLHVEVCLHHRH